MTNCIQECIGQVQEYADVGISVKGSYYPPNKEPKDGERKLFLFIEARSELALARAKTEVIRIMKDSLRQLVSSRNAFVENVIIQRRLLSGLSSPRRWSAGSVQSCLRSVHRLVKISPDRIGHCCCWS